MQTELFGTEPHKLVRRDAPPTSFEAADKVDSTRLEKLVYQTIRDFGPNGCISDEVRGVLHNENYGSVTGRYSALKRKGFIDYLLDENGQIAKRPGASGVGQRIMVAL